ncbi:MAG: hypothetical protein MZW92_10280 [Comamonadaceae bacterium]|nr:hypothetical protein [Comamonadaceae bacterium]
MMHALHYGTSVFEGIRAYKTGKGPAIFRLPEHNDRFLLSAGVVKMKPPLHQGGDRRGHQANRAGEQAR